MNISKKSEKCHLCIPYENTAQTYFLLMRNLMEKLTEVKKEYLNVNKREVYGGKHSFPQLLKCILQDTKIMENNIWGCNHESISSFFKRELKLEEMEFNNLSEMLFNKITLRRYELELVKNLTKNMPLTASISPGDSPKQSKLKASRIKDFKQKPQRPSNDVLRKQFFEQQNSHQAIFSKKSSLRSFSRKETKADVSLKKFTDGTVGSDFLYAPPLNGQECRKKDSDSGEVYPFLNHDGEIDWQKINKH